MNHRSSFLLKRCLLLFWAIWLSVVFATNAMDGAKALGWLRQNWAFASGNYRFLADTTARYDIPAWLNGLLFLGVICWEGTAAVLFWLAWLRFPESREGRGPLMYTAFLISLTLWSAFAIADEVFIAYTVEGTHLRLFTAQLATLLAIAFLPESPFPQGPQAASRR